MNKSKAWKSAADFMDAYEINDADSGSMFWCEGLRERIGRKWGTRRRNVIYKAMVILVAKDNRRTTYLREITARTPRDLRQQFRAEGLRPPVCVGEMCENAGCSPRILDD